VFDSKSGAGPFPPVVKAKTMFVRDITALFREVSQVVPRMNTTLTGASPGGEVGECDLFEMYLEVRVPAGSAVSAGWEPI
jgi:hypothetical protein